MRILFYINNSRIFVHDCLRDGSFKFLILLFILSTIKNRLKYPYDHIVIYLDQKRTKIYENFESPYLRK